jgi:hypothetical protein
VICAFVWSVFWLNIFVADKRDHADRGEADEDGDEDDEGKPKKSKKRVHVVWFSCVYLIC